MLKLILFALLATAYSSIAPAVDSSPSSLITLNQKVELLSKVVSILAILVAGTWAFMRFIRFRTFKKRVEFSFAWKGSETRDGTLLGILTVKLSNKGMTQISLRKDEDFRYSLTQILVHWASKLSNKRVTQISLRNDEDFRCPLFYSLVQLANLDKPAVYLNSRERDLRPLPFLFKAHRLIEPGETIDDVAILDLNVGDAVAIQFHAQVFSVRPNGRREILMSSVAAFPLTAIPDASVVVSGDEQEEYDENTEVRARLKGWVAEAELALQRGYASEKKNEIEGLIEDASKCIEALWGPSVSSDQINAASQSIERLKALIQPLIS
jgi:hypothetical protein